MNTKQFRTATAPLAGTSRRVQQVQTGLGLGLGVQVQGQAELGLGGQGVLRRLPDHSSLALLKNLNFRDSPTTAPLKIDNKPPPRHSPHQSTIIRGR